MPRPPVRHHRRRENASSKDRMLAIERVHIPDPAPARRQLERQLSNKPVGKRPQESDDSDGLVTKNGATGRRRIEIYASGGVAKGDKVNATPSRVTRSRRLRESTEEILSERERSRNSSRAGSDVEGRVVPTPPAREKHATTPSVPNIQNKNSSNTASTNLSAQRETIPASVDLTTRPVDSQTSVLGAFRPRKRQASILQLIDNNESTLMGDDDQDFLPDEVSTPANAKISPRQPISAGSHRTYSSLKRKRDSNVVEPAFAPLDPLDNVEVAPPSRTQKKKLIERQRQEDDVMALPRSSDDESSDGEPHHRLQSPLSAHKRKTPAPTTKQLQSLMPSKRQKTTKHLKAKSIFELPDDSQDVSVEDSADEDDHSTFQPVKSRKGDTQHAGPRSKAKAAIRSSKNKARGTRTSSTPSPVRSRTPLPFSTSKTRNRRIPAKSLSTQVITATRTPLRDKSNHAVPVPSSRRRDQAKKQYGGSLGQTNVAVGQENGIIEADESSNGELHDAKAVRGEAKAWRDKWANIDDFEMEFEEVSFSSSSDPMAR